MYIKLWGVRGSIPTPITSKEYRSRLTRALEFAQESWRKDPDKPAANLMEELPIETATLIGGETTCIEVRDGNDFLILDLGTGVRPLGYELMAKGNLTDIHVLLTHTHWDHIQGWPFFVPGYLPTSNVHFYTGLKGCELRFERQQQFEHFPVEFQQMASKREFHFYTPGSTFQIGPFEVTSFNLRHPGGASAYRVKCKDKTFIFATDTEYFGADLQKQIDASKDFFNNADLLVMDAQYSMEDASTKVGWGHTPTENTIECAHQWNVKKLILTHHEPTYNDGTILELYNNGLETMKKQLTNSDMTVEVGVEGTVYSL